MTNSLADIVVKACPNPWCRGNKSRPHMAHAGVCSPGGKLRDYRVRCFDDRCEIEGPVCQTEAEAIAAWNTRTDPLATLVLEAREALRALAFAEADYRYTHDLYGDGSHEAGRAWDLMRRAGAHARATLAKLESL